MVKVADEWVLRVGRRIGELRRQRGFTQSELGEALGIAQKNVHRLESGTQNLTLRTIAKVADALEVDVMDLLGADAQGDRFVHEGPIAWASDSPRAPRPVPMVSVAAAAGFAKSGQLAEVKGWVLINEAVDERHFVAKVEGDSMAPMIPSGSWCLFRRVAQPPNTGAVVLLQREREGGGGRYLVKRLLRLQSSEGLLRVRLGSDNPAYEPMDLVAASDDDLSILAEFVSVLSDRRAGTQHPGQDALRFARKNEKQKRRTAMASPSKNL